MRWLGFIVFVVGIGVAGVFASRPVAVEVEEGQAIDPADRVWAWTDAAGVGFGIGAMLMIGGAFIARRERGASEGPGGGHAKHLEQVPALLRQINERLAQVPDDPSPANAAATKTALEDVLEELVPRILDQREKMIAQLGLASFAEMISHFATMERNTARAWSALTDEAFAEIPECLERARGGARRALEVLEMQEARK